MLNETSAQCIQNHWKKSNNSFRNTLRKWQRMQDAHSSFPHFNSCVVLWCCKQASLSYLLFSFLFFPLYYHIILPAFCSVLVVLPLNILSNYMYMYIYFLRKNCYAKNSIETHHIKLYFLYPYKSHNKLMLIQQFDLTCMYWNKVD